MRALIGIALFAFASAAHGLDGAEIELGVMRGYVVPVCLNREEGVALLSTAEKYGPDGVSGVLLAEGNHCGLSRYFYKPLRVIARGTLPDGEHLSLIEAIDRDGDAAFMLVAIPIKGEHAI